MRGQETRAQRDPRITRPAHNASVVAGLQTEPPTRQAFRRRSLLPITAAEAIARTANVDGSGTAADAIVIVPLPK